MTDLFKNPTMKERVKDFCSSMEFTSSIDLQNLMDRIKRDEGIVPGLLRIHREARQLCQEGVLRRLTKEEKVFRFSRLKPSIAVYEWVGK
jgi:hypothetical protein